MNNPVLTTVTTTALPVSQVPFPTVTICSEGKEFVFPFFPTYVPTNLCILNFDGTLSKKFENPAWINVMIKLHI